MKQMLVDAGFVDINIAVKENAAEIIKGWMPGSGAENYITSAYITATKPSGSWGLRDNVRVNSSCCPPVAAPPKAAPVGCPPAQVAAGC